VFCTIALNLCCLCLCSIGFASSSVAVYWMIVCSFRPTQVVFVSCNEFFPAGEIRQDPIALAAVFVPSEPFFSFRLAWTPSSLRFSETASPETLGSSRLKNRKTFLLKRHLKQPLLVVEISNLTTANSFPSLDLLGRPSVWHMSIATSVPGKRWVRTVSVATGDPALGRSSRQDRPKTPISSRYRAIGPPQKTCSELYIISQGQGRVGLAPKLDAPCLRGPNFRLCAWTCLT
jgi:hypothetical protein